MKKEVKKIETFRINIIIGNNNDDPTLPPSIQISHVKLNFLYVRGKKPFIRGFGATMLHVELFRSPPLCSGFFYSLALTMINHVHLIFNLIFLLNLCFFDAIVNQNTERQFDADQFVVLT